MPDKINNSNSHNWVLRGCLIPLGVLILLIIISVIWMNWNPSPKPPPYISEVEDKVEESIAQIDQKIKNIGNQKSYDPDQTVMALFSIEKVLTESTNFEELTPFIIQKESDLVAPDVAKLKYRFFNVYKKLLEDKDELDDLESIYNITSGAVTDILGVIGYNATSGVTIDRDQAKQVWEKRLAGEKAERNVKERLRKQQDKMLDLLFEYAVLSSKYLKEWETLCSMRDRAYLALYERDWDEMIASSSAAVDVAPQEKEAHILLAMGLIERNTEADSANAKTLVNKFLKNHQGQQAPAYLLRGVMHYNAGEYDQAALDFDQAAAYFPKQQEDITDKLNLYKKRHFLNKSKEGRMIINMYRGIMSGSGYYSPDFQKARIHIKQNDKEKARKKIFDHFFRRRLQGQWDQVLMDFHFCKNYIQSDFNEIFNGEDLALEIEPAWLTNSLIVSIKNDNKKEIHNLTLLLCVRFTDMFIGDYISFPIGNSVAVLRPGETVKVGRKNISDVTKEKIGTVKKWKDIIEYGAVLISDELIAWVEPVNRGPIQEDQPEKDKAEKQPEKPNDLKNTAKKAAKEIINKAIDAIGENK